MNSSTTMTADDRGAMSGENPPGNVRVWSGLPEAVTGALRAAGRDRGLPLPELFAAATALYLHRFTRARELALVVATDEQKSSLRFVVDPQETFSHFVAQIVAGAGESDHDAENPDESLGRVISIQGVSHIDDSAWTDESTTAAVGAAGPVEKIGFCFRENAAGPGLFIQLEAPADFATSEGLSAHLRRFIALLGQLADASFDTPLNRFVIVDAEERRMLLERFNTTKPPAVADAILPTLFELQAARTPDAVALMFDDASMSYRELNVRANRLAHHLRSLGVGPDVLVAIFVDRSMEMVVAVLGILKAGGVYFPLDPTLPQQRLAFLLSDAACSMVITQDSSLELLKECDPAGESSRRLLVLDTARMESRPDTDANPVPVNKSEDLAYVLYTSGSTGQPKGVELPHRALTNLIEWQCATSAMKSGNRTLQFASLGFDVSFQEIFSTWISGGTLVLISDETRKDPDTLLATIVRFKVERVFLPFVMVDRLAEVGQRAAHPPASLKEVIVAGEQLRIGPTIRRFFELLPACRLWNQYGPTEAHVVTGYEMSAPASAWPDLPSIGRPLPNCEILVLDEQRELVPVGTVGELWIGGVCLARGYRQRPDLTDERFIAHPFHREPNACLYRTGDLARWHEDGTIEFLGRADQQVKIRGFRIEPGEIESVLTAQAEVAQAAVVALDHGLTGKQLVAYVVPAAGKAIVSTALRRALTKRLPTYMVPAAFVPLDSLPLTPNGKLDRRALPVPQPCHHEIGDPSIVPETPLEYELATIWKRVLGLSAVGMRDNFFELGGHSLLAVQLVHEINRTLESKLSTLDLFQAQTIEELARVLEAATHTKREPKLIQLQEGAGAASLVFIYQEGGVNNFHLVQRLDTDRPVYATVVPITDTALQAWTTARPADLPTLEALAASHARIIQGGQLSGPCVLLGHSFNGLLAFEVAHQLRRLGRKVEAVFLLDAEVGVRPRGWWLKNRLPFHLNNLRKLGPRYFLRKLRAMLNRRSNGAASQSGGVVAAANSDSSTEHAITTAWKRVEFIYDRATRRYRAQPLDCPGILIRVHETLSGIYFNDRNLGWGRLFRRGLEVVEVPGSHHSMLDEPHVQITAEQVNAGLRRINEARSRPEVLRNSVVNQLMLWVSVKIAGHCELLDELLDCTESVRIF